MNNLHISLTDFKNESRVLKEADSLIRKSLFDVIYIAALHNDGLSIEEFLGERLYIKRFVLQTRAWKKSFVVQIVKYLEFCYKIYKFYRLKNIGVITVHSLGLLPLGVALKFLYNSKLVYDAHELETEVDYSTGIRKIVNKLVERICIPHADITIVVSESIADWYATEYKMTRPHVVLNSPPFRKLLPRNYFREQLDIQANQKIVLYQGGLVEGRGINLIIEAFKARSDNRVVLVFMGYGPLESDVVQVAKQNKNVFFYSAVSPDIVLEYTASADIGISLIENTCLSYYYCLPNKLFEYSMAGLPVIVSNMKEMSDFVKMNAIGMVIKETSPEAINQAIDNLLALNLDVLRTNAFNTACENSWERQETIMLKAYSQLNLF